MENQVKNFKREELEKFIPQMEQILDSVKVLKDVDTKNVQPMKQHLPFSELREDIAGESMKQKDVLLNAKYTENGMVKVYGEVLKYPDLHFSACILGYGE